MPIVAVKNYDQLLNYAFRILSKKRYTVFEMRNKCEQYLRKRSREIDGFGNGQRVANESDQTVTDGCGQMDDGLVDKVIARLLELKYLDDELFVKDYVRDRFKLKPCGKLLIIRQLKLKGIPWELIESETGKACEDLGVDELRLAMDVLNNRRERWRSIPILKQKSRAANLLISRGFSSNIVYKAISSCYNAFESGI